MFAENHIHKTALKLLRAYGTSALAEARAWHRHFIESGQMVERTVWIRIAWEIRRRQRAEA